MSDPTLYVRRELASHPEIAAMVGGGGGWHVWVFRWRLQVPLEETGERAVVIGRPRPWSIPNRHNTAEFPLVEVIAYADCTRLDGKVMSDDAEPRALELAEAVRRILHRPGGGHIEWGDESGRLRIVSATAHEDPVVSRVEDSETVARARLSFACVIG